MDGTTALVPSIEHALGQRLMPLPLLTRFLSLLPVPAHEIAQSVDHELDANPMLVRTEGMSCSGCGRFLRRRSCAICSTVRLRAADIAARGDWRADLLTQVAVELPADQRDVAEAVIAMIEQSGILSDSPADVASFLGVSETAVDRVLRAIRLVGPPGIASRTPLEVVRARCRALVDSGIAPPFLLQMVDDDCLPLVADRDTEGLAARLEVGAQQIVDAIALLRTRARPVVELDSAAAAYVQPDIYIRYRLDDPTQLVVEVIDANWFGLSVAAVPSAAAAWAAPQQQAARDFIARLNARGSLLRRIGHLLATRQREFLVEGRGHVATRRADVADALGVHASTIGRAVRDKYVCGPTGRTIALASCFGADLGPLEALATLMESHPTASDRELSELLGEHGVSLARRTVAKYRHRLDVVPRSAKSISLHDR